MDETTEPPATDLSSILSWYTGAAQEKVRSLLPTLAACERAGYWLPGVASRSVRSALSDQAVARKFSRANDRDVNVRHRVDHEGLLVDVTDARGASGVQPRLRGWELVHAMKFGVLADAPELAQLADELAPHARGEAERAALARARQWTSDFAPVARLLEALDATRARPSYELLGEVSPTVRRNVGGKMKLSFETVRAPEVEFRRVPVEEEGQVGWTWLCILHWPAGTQHDRSAFRGCDQCQACGHRIRDRRNWCPLVLDGPDGPASLWVGRDCARTLFRCRLSGEGTFVRPEAAAPESLALASEATP